MKIQRRPSQLFPEEDSASGSSASADAVHAGTIAIIAAVATGDAAAAAAAASKAPLCVCGRLLSLCDCRSGCGDGGDFGRHTLQGKDSNGIQDYGIGGVGASDGHSSDKGASSSSDTWRLQPVTATAGRGCSGCGNGVGLCICSDTDVADIFNAARGLDGSGAASSKEMPQAPLFSSLSQTPLLTRTRIEMLEAQGRAWLQDLRDQERQSGQPMIEEREHYAAIELLAAATGPTRFTNARAPEPRGVFSIDGYVPDDVTYKDWTLPPGWEPPVQAKPLVCDLEDMFSYHRDHTHTCQQAMPPGVVNYLCHAIRRRNYRSAFSGVDAPGSMQSAFAAYLGDSVLEPIEEPNHQSAIEWLAASQLELARHPNPPRCVFKDIASFWKTSVRRTIAQLRSQGFPVNRFTLMLLIRSKAAVNLHAPFVVHGRRCQIHKSREVWAGWPCVSFSPQGQRKKDEGQDFEHWAAFMSLLLALEDCAGFGSGRATNN